MFYQNPSFVIKVISFLQCENSSPWITPGAFLSEKQVKAFASGTINFRGI